MKKTRFIKLMILMMCALNAGICSSSAEKIKLRTGKVIEGEVLEKTEDFIKIKSEEETYVIKKRHIDDGTAPVRSQSGEYIRKHKIRSLTKEEGDSPGREPEKKYRPADAFWGDPEYINTDIKGKSSDIKDDQGREEPRGRALPKSLANVDCRKPDACPAGQECFQSQCIDNSIFANAPQCSEHSQCDQPCDNCKQGMFSCIFKDYGVNTSLVTYGRCVECGSDFDCNNDSVCRAYQCVER